jgi:hypothetical protein
MKSRMTNEGVNSILAQGTGHRAQGEVFNLVPYALGLLPWVTYEKNRKK